MDYTTLSKDIKKSKYSLEGIANKVGMSRGGLHQSIKDRTLKIETLEKICEVTGEPVAKYFQGGKEMLQEEKTRERKKKRLTGNERIKTLVDQKTGGNMKKFAEEIGSTKERVHNIIKGSGNFRMDIVDMIMKRYPEVDLYWLITGRKKKKDRVMKRLDEIYQEVLRLKNK